MKKKRCSSCKMLLPVEDFSRKVEAKDGRQHQCKDCAYHGSSRQREPEFRGPDGSNWLPVAPFREWLEETIPKYESLVMFAETVGIPDRTIRRILRESQKVQLGLVDHVLIHEGGTMLWELYPDE